MMSFSTSSTGLADDFQTLCTHAGFSANKAEGAPTTSTMKDGRTVVSGTRYMVRIVQAKNEPTINHGHCNSQSGQSETIIDGRGVMVYCVTVPNGIFMVRKNGKPVWTGNSSR